MSESTHAVNLSFLVAIPCPPSITLASALQIAQSCNRCTAVGLARTPEVDLRLFLPPPPCPDRFAQTSTPKLFERILSALPSDSPYVHDCIRTLTSTALDSYVPGCDDEALADADLGNEFNRDSDVVMFPVALRRRYTERNLVDFCLQALLGHSTVGAHCIKMIEQGVLPVFAKILRDHPNNPAIKSLIGALNLVFFYMDNFSSLASFFLSFSGKILANISLHEETHEAVFRSGWVGILAAWKQDPNLLVTLPATKALCNLDQKYGDVYMPGVYLLLPEHRSVRHLNEISNWGVDVVFIHGMLGTLPCCGCWHYHGYYGLSLMRSLFKTSNESSVKAFSPRINTLLRVLSFARF